MDNNIAFSFIMPAYKGMFLYKAIDSILKQSFREFELIIINDASPDNLTEIIGMFHDERIKYRINETNIGGKDLIANWNHCIQFAKNDYIILATDDDMLEPNFLSEAVKLIQKYPKVNIIRSGVKKVNEKDILLDYEFPLKEYMTSREYALFYAKGGTISCISNYIIKRSALNDIGGFISFPHAHYSDDATIFALSYNGIACIPSNEMNFRVSSINLSNSSDLCLVKEQIKATEQFMGWYLNHIKLLDTNPEDFFGRACYGGIKAKYITMLEKLLNKIPITRIYLTIKTIISIKHLFGRERILIAVNYFINTL